MPSNSHQAGGDSPVWWRSRWLDAMAEAGVKPMPRLVAYVYAEHARQRRDAWVPISRLIERTGMSESTAIRSRKTLVADGWLAEIEKASQHKAARFALTIPAAFSPVALTPLEDPDLSERAPRPVALTAQTCQSDTQSISHQPQHQSLSSNQRALQEALGCRDDDERLKIADHLFEANDVRFAAAWLRTAKRNGTLDERIADAMKPDTRRINNEHWDNGGGFMDGYDTKSRTTGTVEQIECPTPDCGQLIRTDRLHLPCPVCRTINKPLLKDVNAS